jgi:hypothetical protein
MSDALVMVAHSSVPDLDCHAKSEVALFQGTETVRAWLIVR